MFKKLFLILLFVFTVGIFALPATHVLAADNTPVFSGSCDDFAGLVSWSCGVNISAGSQDSLKEGIWNIVANVAVDITIIAAYLVLGYVIYGGYLYTMSGGDPGKVANGKKTLTNAFIGLAIVLSANAIMGSIRIVLFANTNGNMSNCASSECIDPGQMVENLIQWFIGFVGIVAAAFVVVGAIGYISSSGDPSKLTKAKNTIIYALIGLIIVALAEIITSFVASTINKANAEALTNETLVARQIQPHHHCT